MGAAIVGVWLLVAFAAIGRRTYWVKAQYDHDGGLVTAKVAVSNQDLQRHRAGQRVGLTYAPGRSELVRLDPPEWPVARGS